VVASATNTDFGDPVGKLFNPLPKIVAGREGACYYFSEKAISALGLLGLMF